MSLIAKGSDDRANMTCIKAYLLKGQTFSIKPYVPGGPDLFIRSDHEIAS